MKFIWRKGDAPTIHQATLKSQIRMVAIVASMLYQIAILRTRQSMRIHFHQIYIYAHARRTINADEQPAARYEEA